MEKRPSSAAELSRRRRKLSVVLGQSRKTEEQILKEKADAEQLAKKEEEENAAIKTRKEFLESKLKELNYPPGFNPVFDAAHEKAGLDTTESTKKTLHAGLSGASSS